MKRGIILIAAAIQFILSGCGDILTVTVSNPLEADRQPELVEIPVTDVYAALGLKDNETFVVSNGKNKAKTYVLDVRKTKAESLVIGNVVVYAYNKTVAYPRTDIVQHICNRGIVKHGNGLRVNRHFYNTDTLVI